MFGKPLVLEPLVSTPPRTAPESLFLVHATAENLKKYGPSAAYIDRLGDPFEARRQLLDAKICQAPEQDKDEFQSLYNGLKALLAGSVKEIAYLIPAGHTRDPFNYPPIPNSNVKCYFFEQAMHTCKFNGFNFGDVALIRYPGQSRKALDGLIKLVREANEEWLERTHPKKPEDNRPNFWLSRNPNAPEPAPAIA